MWDEVDRHLRSMDGVVSTEAWGEIAYFYNPGQRLKRGAYFATLKQKNGDNDRASELDRPGVWRLNFGAEKAEFAARFGPPPARPAKGGIVQGQWDFTALDQLTPHPVYGWMSWMAILSPSPESFAECQPLLEGAWRRAQKTFDRRVGGSGPGHAPE
jgi:hypothetical protein